MSTIMLPRGEKNEADHVTVLINGRTFKIPKGVEVSIPNPRKPRTNADRIRAMSDKELAKMIDAFNAYFGMCNRDEIELLCTDCELHDLCCLGEGDALGWLRQPVKDGEDDG